MQRSGVKVIIIIGKSLKRPTARGSLAINCIFYKLQQLIIFKKSKVYNFFERDGSFPLRATLDLGLLCGDVHAITLCCRLASTLQDIIIKSWYFTKDCSVEYTHKKRIPRDGEYARVRNSL